MPRLTTSPVHLSRAEDVKLRADAARSSAESQLEHAEQVTQFLSEASEAQGEADLAIQNAQDDIDEARKDLAQVREGTSQAYVSGRGAIPQNPPSLEGATRGHLLPLKFWLESGIRMQQKVKIWVFGLFGLFHIIPPSQAISLRHVYGRKHRWADGGRPWKLSP